MDLQLDFSPRTAGTRRLLIGLAAITGLVCGAGGALAQGHRAPSTPSAPPAPTVVGTPSRVQPPTPPPAPSPLATRVFTLAGGPSSYTFHSVDEGRAIELRLENDQIVTAKMGGEDVPADRIVREGNTIIFKDDKGETVFTHIISQPRESRWLTAKVDPYRIAATAPLNLAKGQALAWSGKGPGPDEDIFIQMEPPKVMLGLTMMEPDASLRGHLGLEQGATTLVGMIYLDLPADAAGLEPYDIITAVDGKSPAGTEVIRGVLRQKNPGEQIAFKILRRGKEQEVSIKLDAYDPERFDNSRVKAIELAFDDEDSKLAERLTSTSPGGRYGNIRIGTDPTGKATEFFDLSQANAEMRQRALEAQVRAEAELARAEAQLIDRTMQTKSLEDRMRRMEEMLNRLLEEKGKRDEKGGGGAGAAPIPDELRPSKGLWAGRNPAA